MEAKVLVNASNLHKGGGVQVASSFIFELSLMEHEGIDITIIASDEVADSVRRLGVGVDIGGRIKVVNTFGLGAIFSRFNRLLPQYDLVFTVFGPNYFRAARYVNLVGFAQPWIIDKSGYRLLSIAGRIKAKLIFSIQRWFFKRSDALVVELEHVRDSLVASKVASSDAIYVAYNCISSLYLDERAWEPVKLSRRENGLKVGFLGRDYLHKNTNVLPAIKDRLRQKYGLDVEFFVTFNDREWGRKSNYFKSNVTNVGSLTVAQCPAFYKSMDAVIFPSLLECFSATPLEAMVMKRPLFASDRKFIKDICGDFACYFDPLNPCSAASAIANYFDQSRHLSEAALSQAREHAIKFSSARGRALKYIEVINDLLVKRK